MNDLVSINEIALHIGESRNYVRDKLVKHGFDVSAIIQPLDATPE